MACSTSSSEDEEEARKLAEIAGIVDLEVEKYAERRTTQQRCGSDKTSSGPSLRNWKRDEEESKISNNLITPEFRKHVAKKLSSYLESCIEEANCPKENGKPVEPETGIQLFRSSSERVIDVESVNLQRQTLSRTRDLGPSSDSSDNEEDMARFSEAAVSGFTILANGLVADTKKNQHKHEVTETANNTEMEEKRSSHKTKKKKKRVEDKEQRKKKKHKSDQDRKTEEKKKKAQNV